MYTYNEDNQLTQVQYDTDNGIGNQLIEIKYDERGNIVEEGTIYDANGRVTESLYGIYALGDFREGKCIWNYGDFYIYNE